MKCAVPVMEVGPSGSPSRRRAQTAAVSCRLRAGVGSDCREGPLSAGQVCDEKANVCKPLLTHRNVERWRRNRGLWVSPGERCAFGHVLSQGAVCVLPWRCPVYRWRELVAGAGMEQENLSPRTDGQQRTGRMWPGWARKGGPRAVITVSGRVPRGTGADRLVVVMKAV